MKKHWKTSLALVLGVMLLLGGFARWGLANDEAEEKDNPVEIKREVFVNGSASIKVEPDQAYLQLGIVTEDPSAEVSQEKNAVISAQIVLALEELGIEPKNIRTVQYHIQPMYKYVENR